MDASLDGVARQSFGLTRAEFYKRSIASRKGELLAVSSANSDSYASYLLSVRCVRGHEFSLSARNLMRGSWCAECRQLDGLNAAQAALARAREWATSQGGLCLSERYQTARRPLLWQCRLQHQWLASWDNVRNKRSWCPRCARKTPSS